MKTPLFWIALIVIMTIGGFAAGQAPAPQGGNSLFVFALPQ
jgi:hypothetical protein